MKHKALLFTTSDQTNAPLASSVKLCHCAILLYHYWRPKTKKQNYKWCAILADTLAIFMILATQKIAVQQSN